MKDAKEFCVYITIYRGNKLPPFYIGYSTVDKIERGYNGSVSSKTYAKVWSQERKENKSLFKTKIIKIFATRSEARKYEEYAQKFFNVHRNPMFINMSIGYSKFNMDEAFDKGEHHFQNSAFQSAVNRIRIEKGTHLFCNNEFQKSNSAKAHSNPSHPFHGGQLAKELNAKRIAAGTHNFQLGGNIVREFAAKQNSRDNVKVLRELAKKQKVKLGRNWYKKTDDWINEQINLLLNV